MSDASRAIRALLCSAVRPLLSQTPLHDWVQSDVSECQIESMNLWSNPSHGVSSIGTPFGDHSMFGHTDTRSSENPDTISERGVLLWSGI